MPIFGQAKGKIGPARKRFRILNFTEQYIEM
jgi:hypothetical protein